MRGVPPHLLAATAVIVLAASASLAQNVRDHTRLKGDRPAVTESQATELTLTMTEVSVRPVQVWVRTAGTIDPATKTVTASVSSEEGAMLKAGQRVRAFPPESRSLMYQARITQVSSQPDRVLLRARLTGQAREGATHYVLEIVTEHGDHLSVPNEAIIETKGKHVVYVQEQAGRYLPREIQLGVQGELYTAVLGGVKAGEQVVTFGSFFIDADYKLKGQ